MHRIGIIGSAVGAAMLLHAFHWSQILHLTAQLGDIVAAVMATIIAYLAYKQLEILKLQLDGPPPSPPARTTGRAVECNQYLEDLK